MSVLAKKKHYKDFLLLVHPDVSYQDSFLKLD
jgi:hypothetical protein